MIIVTNVVPMCMCSHRIAYKIKQNILEKQQFVEENRPAKGECW